MTNEKQVSDPATQSNYLAVSTSHVHFDWSIDWTKRVIAGSATHTLVAHEDVQQVTQVLPFSRFLQSPKSRNRFDSSYLVIERVEVAGKHADVRRLSSTPPYDYLPIMINSTISSHAMK